MNKILKRLLTGVLTLATVFTALPTTAVHAAETQYWTESEERVGIVEKVMNDGSIGSTFNEGHMTVEGEDAYCIDINTGFKNGYNYLFTIAVNTCNNYCTKKSLNQTELNDSVFSIDVEKSMIDNIIENENSIIIQKALDTLPDMQREAIILKYYHDFKVKDIAKTTGVSVPTAQSRIQQGLKKLSKLLDRKEFLK